jgi:hypothetical protein
LLNLAFPAVSFCIFFAISSVDVALRGSSDNVSVRGSTTPSPFSFGVFVKFPFIQVIHLLS